MRHAPLPLGLRAAAQQPPNCHRAVERTQTATKLTTASKNPGPAAGCDPARRVTPPSVPQLDALRRKRASGMEWLFRLATPARPPRPSHIEWVRLSLRLGGRLLRLGPITEGTSLPLLACLLLGAASPFCFARPHRCTAAFALQPARNLSAWEGGPRLLWAYDCPRHTPPPE